jgi:hypothetical protein
MVLDNIIIKDNFTYFLQECAILSHGTRIRMKNYLEMPDPDVRKVFIIS